MNFMKEFRVRAGTIIGAEHQRRQTNNQDSYATGRMKHQEKDYLWGIICDGCTAEPHSEVGAILLSNYLCREIPYLISSGSTIQEIPDQLFIAGLGFLRSLASHTAMGGYQERIDFIVHHLLCTVIGFIMDDEHCVFFTAGDGVVITNEEIEVIDQRDKPLYMGYHLVDKSLLKGFTEPLLLKFVTRVRAVKELERFAICSDGMKEGVRANAVDQIWNHDHPLGLQRELRRLRLQRKVAFSDDCTVITIERKKIE